MRLPACFEDKDARRIIDGVCEANQIDSQLISDLCEIAHSYSGSGRSHGITEDIIRCITEFEARVGRRRG